MANLQKKSFWQQYGNLILILSGILIGPHRRGRPRLRHHHQAHRRHFLEPAVHHRGPLVFVSIASAVGSMANMKRLGKILGGTIGTFIFTGHRRRLRAGVGQPVQPLGGHHHRAGGQRGGRGTDRRRAAGQLPHRVRLLRPVGQVQHAAPHHLRHSLRLLRLRLRRRAEPHGQAAGQPERHHHEVRGHHHAGGPHRPRAYFANLVATYGPEIIGDYGRSMLVYYPCAPSMG